VTASATPYCTGPLTSRRKPLPARRFVIVNCQKNSVMANIPDIHSIIGHTTLIGPLVVETENTENWSASVKAVCNMSRLPVQIVFIAASKALAIRSPSPAPI
jgi:hypothetical protein